MAKRVFFSFHYQDVIDFRANVVRNHWLTKPDREAAGFFDASVWEAAKKTNPTAVKNLIHSGLDGTSTTCVLVGSHTYARQWVRYELMKSFRKGNKILGVHINSIAGKDKLTKLQGPNPLEHLGVAFSASGDTATMYEKTNGTWREYSEIGGSASYSCSRTVDEPYRGKSFHLGQWYRLFDWVSDDGYKNFASWVA